MESWISSESLRLMSTIVGACVIIAVSVMKVPQIIAVVKMKSSQGLSINSLLIEIAGLVIITGYAVVKQLPLSSYGETYLLLVQDFILVWLAFYYSKIFTTATVVVHVFAVAFWLGIFYEVIPYNVIQILLLAILPSPYIGITMQIATIIQDKSSGNLSPTSFLLGLLTILARVFTTAIDTDDKILLWNAIFLVVMNIILYYFVLKFQDTDKKESKKA